MNKFLNILAIVIFFGVATSTTYAFAYLSDLKGHVKTDIGFDKKEGKVILGHRIGPDGNLQLVYKD